MTSRFLPRGGGTVDWSREPRWRSRFEGDTMISVSNTLRLRFKGRHGYSLPFMGHRGPWLVVFLLLHYYHSWGSPVHHHGLSVPQEARLPHFQFPSQPSHVCTHSLDLVCTRSCIISHLAGPPSLPPTPAILLPRPLTHHCSLPVTPSTTSLHSCPAQTPQAPRWAGSPSSQMQRSVLGPPLTPAAASGHESSALRPALSRLQVALGFLPPHRQALMPISASSSSLNKDVPGPSSRSSSPLHIHPHHHPCPVILSSTSINR